MTGRMADVAVLLVAFIVLWRATGGREKERRPAGALLPLNNESTGAGVR